VVVPDADVGAHRRVEAEIVIGMKADVTAVPHVADSTVAARRGTGDVLGVVGRAVIAYDDFERRIILP